MKQEPPRSTICPDMFNKDELAALGNEMLAMFEMLMEREPRRSVPAETGEAAELHPVLM